MSSSDAEIAARLQMEENLKAQIGGGGRRTVRGRVSNCIRQQLLFSSFFFFLTTITNILPFIFFHFFLQGYRQQADDGDHLEGGDMRVVNDIFDNDFPADLFD